FLLASAAQNPLWYVVEKREAPRDSSASVAVSTIQPLSEAASRTSTAGDERLMIVMIPSGPRRSAAADTRSSGLQCRRVRIPVADPLALCGRTLRFTVGLGRHVDVLGVDLGHHDLPELDELLELFGGHHIPELERLHAPLSALAHCLERLDAALLGREILSVETDGVQRPAQRIEGRLRPHVVLSRPVGHGAVAGVA